MILHHFEINSSAILENIKVYKSLIENLDKNEYSGQTSNKIDSQNILVIKQHIYLDIVIKIIILIEVTLVIVDVLSSGYYKSLPHRLTYYSLESVFEYIRKIRENKYNWRNVLGLLRPSTLPLSKNEQRCLFANYKIEYAMIKEALNKLADFYDKFRIIYTKSKHGLTIQSGLIYPSETETDQLKKSIMVCMDRRERSRMPKSYIDSKPLDDYSGFFNSVGVLSFNQQLFDEINSVYLDLRGIIYYLCENHLTYAKNCGEGYLPYDVSQDGRIGIRYAVDPNLSDADRMTLNGIADKIAPLINTVQDQLTTNFTTKRQDIIESILKKSVTNLYIVPDPSLKKTISDDRLH